MAQKRYLDKKISISEKVADLSILGQLLYTLAIPHADDFGFLQASPRTIKAQVIPMVDVSLDEVKEVVAQMLENGLWEQIEVEGRELYRIANFAENQKFRTDINPWVIFPFDYTNSPVENWKRCEEIIGKCYVTTPKEQAYVPDLLRDVPDPQGKIREDKLREDKLIKTTLVHLVNTNSIAGTRTKQLPPNNTGGESSSGIFLLKPENFQPTEGMEVILKNGHAKSLSGEDPTPEDVQEGMDFLKQLLGIDNRHPLPKESDQRKAYVRLFRVRGKENIYKVMVYGRSVSGEKGFPVITNYLDLDQKWEPLIVATKRKVEDLTVMKGVDLSKLSP